MQSSVLSSISSLQALVPSSEEKNGLFLEVPVELLSLECPCPVLKAVVVQEYQELARGYWARLQEVDQQLEALSRYCHSSARLFGGEMCPAACFGGCGWPCPSSWSCSVQGRDCPALGLAGAVHTAEGSQSWQEPSAEIMNCVSGGLRNQQSGVLHMSFSCALAGMEILYSQ